MKSRSPSPSARTVITSAAAARARRATRTAIAPSPAAPPTGGRRRLPRLIWLVAAVAVIGAVVWAAVSLDVADWARWTLAGIAIAAVSSLGIAVLIGPAARRLAGEHQPLTPAERRQMTATERVEAINAARHTLIQAATGLVVIGGVVFTAQGLWYTAQSLDASRQAQRTTEQGQITDRYTKAVEQLGSRTSLDVRLGGIYALERLAQDSPRDHQTIYDVLTAFIREHDPKPKAAMPATPATDIQAVLTIIGRRNTNLEHSFTELDLSHIRIRGADLSGRQLMHVNLNGANLNGANLRGADLRSANLGDADLGDADLSDANLNYANLGGADLRSADLGDADLNRSYLGSRANLRGADLRGADLNRADLGGADLRGADLRGTDLGDAYLLGADLRGADLREVRGRTPDQIRDMARTDSATQF
ncbi:pentapeptide repeat-containing protein [Microbispora tritici]|uniref:Pentapeptide repeat-containing protein n=2 Tax=Microbispora TaxID=2005 RepID=A0ABY3M0S5_9ACTN|nr:pentapeptide repeat-containing protein [Microbispora fusca]TYB61974.1 pentapeptide repeat-containing protein [Microbispora tritici]